MGSQSLTDEAVFPEPDRQADTSDDDGRVDDVAFVADDDPWERFANLHERARRAVETARGLRDRGFAASRLRSVLTELERVTHELDGLKVAMQTRATIEQAKGALMVLYRCSTDEAFALMVRMSQRSQRKLHDVAERIVAEAPTLGAGGGWPADAERLTRGEQLTGAAAGERPPTRV